MTMTDQIIAGLVERFYADMAADNFSETPIGELSDADLVDLYAIMMKEAAQALTQRVRLKTEITRRIRASPKSEIQSQDFHACLNKETPGETQHPAFRIKLTSITEITNAMNEKTKKNEEVEENQEQE